MELDEDFDLLEEDGSTPLSDGTTEHPQPAVILVINHSVGDQKLKEMENLLKSNRLSVFRQKTADQTFLCLYLTEKNCEFLAEEYCYHVPFMTRKDAANPASPWTKLAALAQFGSLSYKSFTEVHYSVAFNQKCKEKLTQRDLKSLYSVRVQSELIYNVLKLERILEEESFQITGDFVPHTPEVVELEKMMSWFPHCFPLQKFRDYFGEEITFVYAWSNFWLVFGLLPIALMGLIALTYGLITEIPVDPTLLGEKSKFWLVVTNVMLNTASDFYFSFLIIWISLFQYQWAKAAPILTIQWGVSSFYREEECSVSAKSKKLKLNLKFPGILISLFGFLIAAVSSLVLFCVTEIILRVQLNKINFGENILDDHKTTVISLACSLVYSILNTILGKFVIPWFARVLTAQEHHKFQSYYNSSLIMKYTGYYLMHSYLYLVYLVFGLNSYLSRHFEVDVDALEECTYGICAITIIQQIVVQTFMLRIMPLLNSLPIVSTFKRFGQLTGLSNTCNSQEVQHAPSSHDLRYILENYNSLTFVSPEESLLWMGDRVLMYGYITMFSYHLPIISLCAAILEMFVTYYETRMLMCSQRPRPRRCGNIRHWEGILYLINIMSIIVNAYAIGRRLQQNATAEELQSPEVLFLPLILLNTFILVIGLIHIQNNATGDRVQAHISAQYHESVRLLTGKLPTCAGLEHTTLV